jgi:hypothetical protein
MSFALKPVAALIDAGVPQVCRDEAVTKLSRHRISGV